MSKKKPTKRKTNGGASKTPDKVEKFTRVLRVILTRDEVEARADRAAHLLAQRDQKEEMMKAAAKQMKSEIETLEAQVREYSTQVRDKAHYVETECERRFDYGRGVVTERRLDNDEELAERPMTPDERQLGLDLDEDAKKDADVDDDFDDSEKGDEAAE